MRKILFIIMIFSSVSVLLFSCTYAPCFSDSEELTLQLPSWPPNDSVKERYPALSRWLIRIESADGKINGIWFTNEADITLTVEKNCPMALTACPITKNLPADDTDSSMEYKFFKPAGLIYPQRKKYITWEDGFLAESMQRIIRSRTETGMSEEHIKNFLSSFNWKKAQETITKKIERALFSDDAENQPDFYNPWLIDENSFNESLSYGEFKSSLINNTSCMSINLTESIPLSSFILENNFIYAHNTILIKKDAPSLFYTEEDCAIILQGGSAKNLSLTPCKLPIFIEDTDDI